MISNELGNSTIEFSRVSFGCMSLDLTDRKQCVDLLRNAVEQGITMFDTADLYDKGLNEEVVGEALAPFRNDIKIATKVGNQWRPDGSGWDWNPTKEYILSAVDRSLNRLNTDHIDLYQLHGGTIDDPVDETIEAFEILKSKGKIVEYGISSIRPNVIRQWVERSNMCSVMMQYSLLDRRPEESVLDLLYKNNVSVITRGSLAKGLLVDKPADAYLGYSRSQVKKLQDKMAEIGSQEAHALHYVWNHPAVATAATGIRTNEHLQAAVTAAETTVEDSSLDSLGSVLPPQRYENHR